VSGPWVASLRKSWVKVKVQGQTAYRNTNSQTFRKHILTRKIYFSVISFLKIFLEDISEGWKAR
jgi:hypothetical protein